MRGWRSLISVLLAVLMPVPLAGAEGTPADIVIAPAFASRYRATDLGAVPNLPGLAGGIAFAPGDPDTLLIGGSATDSAGAIYAVPLSRQCGCIRGYAGPATMVASAPYIDGGLAVGPGDVLFYTSYGPNTLGQITPGSVEASRTIDLSTFGVVPSTGGVTIVPPGLPGAGRIKLTSYDAGLWYDAALAPDGAGTFSVLPGPTLPRALGSGPEGIVYVEPGAPLFPDGAVLVCTYDTWHVDAYDIDDLGSPVIATRRSFIDQLAGAEGATRDPVTSHLLFSSLWFIDRVVVVRSVPACPADIAPPGGDGMVGAADLFALLLAWGQTCVRADINEDGIVNNADLFLLFSGWGACG